MKHWVLLALLCASAAADTGGRMGGGSWKSSGTSRPVTPSSSIGHSWGGSSSSGSSNSSSNFHWDTRPRYTPPPITHDTHYTPPNDYIPSSGSAAYVPPPDMDEFRSHDGDWLDWFVPAFIAIVGLIVFAGFAKDFFFPNGFERKPPAVDIEEFIAFPGPSTLDTIDVSVLRVALDGRARKFVQTELKRIAASTDTSTQDGRVAMLWEVALLLRRLRDAWIYGGAINEPEGPIDSEKPLFDHHVDDARSRFMRETVSNEQGMSSGADPGHSVPRSDQGAGVMLVSIILAAHGELFTVTQIGNGRDLAAALEAAGTLNEQTLVAVEVVWQPAEDADRMSSIELEAKYPFPQLIPIAGALVGKTFCAYCGAPFPAEILSCPHCGAPQAAHS